jgi:hypothetical protein
MDDLERQLKGALAREEAPAGFEARVMNAVNQAARQEGATDNATDNAIARRPRFGARPHIGERPRWQWIFATAAAVVALVGVGSEWEHHLTMERVIVDREAGEAAKAQLQLALRITSTKLAEIQQRIGEPAQ